jgi:hypothetical protein
MNTRFGLRTGKLVAVLLAAGVLCVPALFGQKVQTEFDQSQDFSKFKTFAIRPGRINSPNPSLNNELVHKKLDADIQKYFEARGLTLMSSGRPDLIIRYTLGTPRRVETEVYPAGWRGWGSRVVKVPYTEGTLVIDLRDPGTQSLVWRCIARDEEGDANKIQSKLENMVKKAAQQYPPKMK